MEFRRRTKLQSTDGMGGRLHTQGPASRAIQQWSQRLLGVVEDRSFHSRGEQYEANLTKRDYLWNTIGTSIWGFVFPVLTMIATQLSGAEQAGMFSMAFVVASLLMILANFGLRTYQISDIGEKHSFADYQVNRFITCLAMLIIGFLYCKIRGYDAYMSTMCAGLFLYRMADGFADVYEGRLQQMGKLYLGGISLALRSAIAFVVFTVLLFITRDLGIAAVGMGIVGVLCLLLISIPLAYLETPKSAPLDLSSVIALFAQCWPLFAAFFIYSLVDNMPKFVMEGQLAYDNQLYFNALYFPAQFILIAAQLIYKPMLVSLANTWQDASKRKKFNLIVLAVVAAIIAITAAMAAIMHFVGLWFMGLLYGIDFMQFETLSMIMLVAGGMTAGIDFLYQAATVLRRQRDCLIAYVIALVLSTFVPLLLIHFARLEGACVGYLIVMSVLFLLMLWTYLRIMFEKPQRISENGTEANLQPHQDKGHAYDIARSKARPATGTAKS